MILETPEGQQDYGFKEIKKWENEKRIARMTD